LIELLCGDIWYSFKKALITTEGTQEFLKDREFFDYIITFDDIFNSAYWN
jgi:hypothetical protein